MNLALTPNLAACPSITLRAIACRPLGAHADTGQHAEWSGDQ